MTKTDNTLVIGQSAPFTVINRFQPSAEDQAELVRVLSDGITNEMAPLPGFISAAIHRSLDSTDVLVYAQWVSGEALGNAAAQVQAGKAPNMARGFELGQPQYHPYEVSDVIVARQAVQS
jgi:quinol monooxygenase YgiN